MTTAISPPEKTPAPGTNRSEGKQESRQGQTAVSNKRLQSEISLCRVIPGKPVEVIRNESVAQALRDIAGGKYAGEIEHVRTLVSRHGKDSEQVKAAKLELPAHLFSGMVEGRVAQAMNEGRFLHSGLLQLDFDNLPDPEGTRDMLAIDPHCVAVWLSPSRTGVKGLCLIPPATSEEQHKAAFETVRRYYLDRYELENDKACKNSNRLCFVGWDSGMRLNLEAVPLDITQQAPPAPLAAPSIKTRHKAFPEPPIEGIHSWLMEAAWWCRLAEMSEADTVAKLESYDGSLRRRLQPNEARDAARTVFSTPLDGPQRTTPAPLMGKPAIELPCPGRPLSDFAEDVGAMLAGAGVFSRGGLAFVADPTGQHLEPVDPQWLRTWAERSVSLFKSSRTAAGEVIRLRHTMSLDTAKALIVASPFLEQLPGIRNFLPVRLPVIRDNGEIELLPHGFDAESGTLTNPAGIDYSTDITPERGILAIRGLLKEFPFADERSRAAAVGAMLTVFARGILPAGSTIPCFVYLANAEGSGKTTLAQLAGMPYGIATAESRPATEDEWNKQLLALVMSGARLLLLDNLKGHLNSPALEAYLTATSYSGRILGVSKKFTGPADAAILLTGNRLTVSPDLRRRSIFVELFMQELRAEDRVFNRRLDPPAMLEAQGTILAALWAIVRGWDAAGRPPCSKTNASLPRWSETIAGMVEWAGFDNPAVAAEIEDGGDTDTRDIARLGEAMTPGTRYRFAELCQICAENGLFERFTEDTEQPRPKAGELLEDDSPAPLTRKAKREFSAILGNYHKRIIAPGKRFLADSKGHQRRYFTTEGT